VFKSQKTLKLIIAVAVCVGMLCLVFWALTAMANKTVMKKPVAKRNTKIETRISPTTSPKNIITNPRLELNGFSETMPILMYHYIEVAPASTTLKGLYLDPKIFANQLLELQKNNYKTLFVSEVGASIVSQQKLDQKNIALTFDDGYEDFYTEAYPLLKKYNCKATLYVIINALDKKGYLTRIQVRELADSGLVEIASHTFNHPDLRILKAKDAKFEIMDSKKILEQISGKPVLSFAYPYGYYKTEFFEIASSTGYTSAASVMPGSRQGTDDRWILRRIRPNDRSGQTFIAWLKDWEQAKY
jgi:peptidoglycan/xylan/chitin deacetylase (PgdA/CDA1 family)